MGRRNKVPAVISVLSPNHAIGYSTSGGGGGGATFDYYIGPSGSDSNPGTLASPWAITSLINSASSASTSQAQTNRSALAGKRVGLLDGTYTITSGMYSGISDYAQPVLNIPAGSAGNPTVIQAINARAATIDGNTINSSGPNTLGCCVLGMAAGGAGYVTIDGLEVKNCYYAGLWFGDNGNSTAANGITIQNCYIHDIYATGATGNTGNHAAINLFNTRGATLHNCKIQTVYNDSSVSDHCESIILWNCYDSVVEYSTLKDTWCGVNSKGNNRRITIRYCHIDVSGYTGGSVAGCIRFDGDESSSDNSYYYNNTLISKTFVFQRDLSDSNQVNGYAHWYNNTIVGSTGFKAFYNSGTGGIYFFNNIVYRTGSVDYRGDYNVISGTMQTQDYNCWHNQPTLCIGTGPDTTYTSLASWQSGVSKDAHSIANNTPGFVASGTEAVYYKLTGGAACANAGKSDGTSGGATCDIGAWGNGAPATIGCNF